MIKKVVHFTYKAARRIVVAVVGATVLLLGFVMIVTPGPAFVVIPVGLAILSIEFAWARYWLRRLREAISSRNSNNRSDRAEAHRDRTMDQKRKAPGN
ncbi:MAG: PGPGW domain-containing protein [Woeseiaceae bacterium]